MFSKYDVYTTVQSMYCYPDSDVLKNKLNIRNKAELKQAEEEFTAVKQLVLLQEPMKGRFTKTHLLRIHRFLFEDVYPFVGHIRREQISKGDTLFYPPEMIDRQLGRVFDENHTKKLLSEQNLKKQIQNLSHVMTELNIIHPFREGNGRSIRELIRCMGLEYGLRLNWGNTDRDTLIDAAIASVDDDMAFCDCLLYTSNYKDETTGRIRSHNYNIEYNFREYATWSRISSENVGLRYSPVGYIFDSASAGLFLPHDLLFYGMGFICSNVAKPLLNVLNPTIKIQPGDVAVLPLKIDQSKKENVDCYVRDCIQNAQEDWNAYETAWDFKRNPLV